MENLVTDKYKNLSGLNILVTGGTGVIGSWLIKKLVKLGLNTTILLWGDKLNPELERTNLLDLTTNIQGSLTDMKLLESIVHQHQINLVFHLGAQAIVETALADPFTTFESNIRGTYNLLEACRTNNQNVKGIIVASSDKAYGTHANLPYTENASLNGIYPYEVSKSCTDLLARSYGLTYNLPVSIARCGNVYGGGDLNWNRIIPGTILELFNERNPVLRSDGSHVRDYIYVEDIVDGYLTLASNTVCGIEYGQAFNFGNNNPVSVINLVETITKYMGKEHLQPKITNTAHGEIHSQYLDSSKANHLLQWEPQYSLETGLIQTIEWYTDFLSNSHDKSKIR